MRLAGRDIVCLSVMDWDHPFPTSRHALMARLAARNRVLFVDSFENPGTVLLNLGEERRRGRLARWLGLSPNPRRLAMNFWVYTPPPCVPMGRLPEGPAFDRAYAANQRILGRSVRLTAGRLGFQSPILWLSFSVLMSEGAIGALGESLVVYHCTDDIAALPGVSPAAAEIEQRLIARADLVFCSSPALAASRGGVFVPNGVDFDLFSLARLPDTPVPEALASLPRPVVGYAGQIDERFDFDLLDAVAQMCPSWPFVLVGGVAPVLRHRFESLLSARANVKYFGLVPQTELPGWLKGFDVAILPWRRTPQTRAIYPLKLGEYLAAGLPVVATPFADLPDARDVLYIAGTAEEFVGGLVRAFTEGVAPLAVGARLAVARQASWDGRLAEMEAHVLRALYDRASGSGRVRARS